MRDESGCGPSCPAFAKCTATYRSSACAYLRSSYDLDDDPITNADRIRAMSDEELAEFCIAISDDAFASGLSRDLSEMEYPFDAPHWLDWLQRPAEVVQQKAKSAGVCVRNAKRNYGKRMVP